MSRPADIAALRSDAWAIVRAALDAVAPARLMTALSGDHALRELGSEGAAVLAVGKAADAMVDALIEHDLVPVRSAFIVAPAGTPRAARVGASVARYEAAHPLPDARSVAAATAVIEWLQSLPPSLPLVVLLSGGASALLALPAEDVAVEELAHTTSLLLRAGATVAELNAVRKQLDLVKGGRLAPHAGGRAVLVLAISDVIGDRLDVIGSGPFHPDATTAADALQVLHRRGVLEHASRRVVRHLERGGSRAADAASFRSVRHRIIGSNDTGVHAAARAALQRGYDVDRVVEPVTGEARPAGEWLGARALQAAERGGKRRCIVAGGETTVTVRGTGHGGRNQELALAAALAIAGTEGIVIASIGTDGRDGPTDAAGAIVDGGTAARIAAAGLDARRALDRNDSFTALTAGGAVVRTGATGTNVGDLQLVLVG